MKKNSRKIVSVLLVLCMVMLLGGCGSSEKDALVGTWEAEMNLADVLNEGVASSGEEELAQYLYVDSFNMTMILIFNEDDTYSMKLDESGLNDAIEQLKDDYQVGIEQYFLDMMASMGVEMTIDEIVEAMGMSMEELLDSIVTEEMIQDMLDSSSFEGKFEAADGKLYLSAGLNYNVDKNMYDLYELEGNELTLLETVSDEEVDEFTKAMYPLTFTKVS